MSFLLGCNRRSYKYSQITLKLEVTIIPGIVLDPLQIHCNYPVACESNFLIVTRAGRGPVSWRHWINWWLFNVRNSSFWFTSPWKHLLHTHPMRSFHQCNSKEWVTTMSNQTTRDTPGHCRSIIMISMLKMMRGWTIRNKNIREQNVKII